MCNLFKDICEIIYYIAFIILTVLIVVYAAKTYYLQAEKSSSLFYKLFVPHSELGNSSQHLCLEIYNHGNTPAKNIEIFYNGKSIAVIDFIRPEDNYSLPFGYIRRTLDRNRVFIPDTIQDDEIMSGNSIYIVVKENGNKPVCKVLNTSALFLRDDIPHNEFERIAKSLEEINRNLKRNVR